MRIALVTDTYAPAVNGVATFTSSLAIELAACGHKVAVLAPAFPGSASLAANGTAGGTLEEVRFHSIRLPGYHSARAAFGWQSGASVRRFLEAFRPDVVHLQTHFFLAKEVLKSAHQLGIPALATCHSNSENLLLNFPVIGRMTGLLSHVYWKDAVSVYSRAQLMTVPAASMTDVLRRWGFTGPVKVVRNGVNTTLFNNQPSSLDEAVRARHKIPLRDSLLFVGRLDKDKGVPGLIHLLRMFASTGTGHLIVCGSGTEISRLRKAAGDFGVSERLSLTGAISPGELSSVYRLASALVLVERHEVQPLAVLEAFASGLPAICLRSRNLEETVVDGVNGFLAESVGHVYQLGRQLIDDDELRATLSKNARQTAEARFSLNMAAREFLTCYQSVTSGANGRELAP